MNVVTAKVGMGITAGSSSATMNAEVSSSIFSDIGKSISETADSLATGAADVAKAAKEAVGEMADTAGKAWDDVSAHLDKVAQHIPKVDVAKIGGKVIDAFTPPRPDIKLSGRLELFDNLKLRFKLENGGFAGDSKVKVKDAKSDGSLTFEGNISVSLKNEISSMVKLVASLPVGTKDINAKLGFDLSLKLAENPLLSAAMSFIPNCLETLVEARKQVDGGFKHLKAFFNDLFGGIKVAGNAQILVRADKDVRMHAGGSATFDETGGRSGRAIGGGGNNTRLAEATQSAASNILNNPNLSFEDKVFLFCLGIAKRQEDKIEKMMEDWDNTKNLAAAGQGGETRTEGPGGGGSADPTGLLDFSKAGSMVGGIVGFAKNAGSSLLGIASTVVPLLMSTLGPMVGAACSAIPYVGGAVGPAVTAICSPPIGPALVGGGLAAGSALLKAAPLEQIGQSQATQLTDLMNRAGGSDVTAMLGSSAPKGPGGGPDPSSLLTGLVGGSGLGAAGLLVGGLAHLPLAASGVGIPVGVMMSLACAGLGLMAGGALGAGGQGASDGAATKGAIRSPTVPTSPSASRTQGTDATATAPGATSTGEPSAANKPDSEAMFTQKLTHEQQQLTKIYDMLSNMMKASHDTQMSAIRNMR